MAEAVNQCRDGKNIPGFLSHRCAQRGNRLVKMVLLEQGQAETKVELVPPWLQLYSLTKLFSRIFKPSRVVKRMPDFLDRHQREGIKRFGMAMDCNRLLREPGITK